MEEVLNLFFAVTYAEAMYMEHQFLSVAQTAESFHRHRYPGGVLPVEDHKKRLSSILEAAPAEYHEWLSDKLKYSNEPNLRQRLRQLLDRVGPVADDLIDNRRKFVNAVVDTRNHYTHYTPESGSRAATGVEVMKLTRIMTFIVQACFLTEAGISPAQCAELFSQNRRYQSQRERK
jgi:hypothetical protein